MPMTLNGADFLPKEPCGNLFHVEVRHGVYLIGDDAQTPTRDGRSLALGEPTGNCYLVVGDEKALLIDAAIDHPALRKYVEMLAGKPVQLALSHGHGDHTFGANQFADVWMHPADIPLLNGAIGFPAVIPCPRIHPLGDGDVLDMGNRPLDVYHLPGHTGGSILFLDRRVKALFTGDTIARRLLYGLGAAMGLEDFVPIETFCEGLEWIQRQGFEVIYSAHDRSALPREYIAYMLNKLRHDLPHAHERISIAGNEHIWLRGGDCHLFDFFDMTFPCRFLPSDAYRPDEA